MAPLRIAIVSDLHGRLPRIPPCDLLIMSGDIGPDDDYPFSATNALRQLSWFNHQFAQWLQTVPADEIVATPGNHDFGLFRVRYGLSQDLRWHLLIDQGVELFGFKIWGSPWVSGDISRQWAFKLDEEILAVRWSRIPDDTDILVLHSPPFGIMDKHKDGAHLGSKSLRARADRLETLKLVTFGHIHGNYDCQVWGQTKMVNAALVNEGLLVNPPRVLLLDRPESREVPFEAEDACQLLGTTL